MAIKAHPWPWAKDVGVDKKGLWAELVIESVHQRLRWIVPGSFMMGSPATDKEAYDDEKPQHQVTLTQGYWLGETSCTQALWQAVMGDNPSAEEHIGKQMPVNQVSWEDCRIFFERLSSILPGLACHLPTEAQWEYACRAGTSTPFSFGEQLTTEQANYDGKYRRRTVRVSQFEPNHWGLFQMHGNVWEFCQDGYGKYPEKIVIDPQSLADGRYRVLRGGGWINHAGYLRCASRIHDNPGFLNSHRGLRLAGG